LGNAFPQIFLVRHGETEWSLSGQHTGRTDIALTPKGEKAAEMLGATLRGIRFDQAYSSPLQRAHRTAILSGVGQSADLWQDLVEWDYGDYEGLTIEAIRKVEPGWLVFKNGAPNGESVSNVIDRADRICRRLRELKGNTLIFSSGHILRALAARWLNADLDLAGKLLLNTASVSILGYDKGTDDPAIRLWNYNDTLLAQNGKQG
jgi:broad specificity phosphatase PhoE